MTRPRAMTINLVPERIMITDPASGLACHFDHDDAGVLVRSLDRCCHYEADDYRGLAALELAVAGERPIVWQVDHAECAIMLSCLLVDLGITQITVEDSSRPLAA